MNEAKKMIIFTAIGIFTILLGVSGVAYSWVNNNDTNKDNVSSVLVKDEELSVIFDNGTLIEANYLKDNETVEKKFTVKNTGSGAISYNILWSYINNEYTNKEGLTYNLKYEDGRKILLDTQVPITGANIPILKNVILEKNESYTYILEIRYKSNKNIKVKEQTLNAKIEIKSNNEDL